MRFPRVPPSHCGAGSLKLSRTSLTPRAASLLWCAVASLTGGHSPGGSDGKEAACNEGNAGLIPGSGRCPGEGNGYSLQYPCLENSMDREAGGTQSRLSQRLRHDWVTNTHTHILEFLGPKVRGPLPVRPGVVKSGNGSSAVTEPSALCLVRGQLTSDSARVCNLSPHAFQALIASPFDLFLIPPHLRSRTFQEFPSTYTD